MENLATSLNVLCTLATYVQKIAELKAEKLKVKLPSGVGSTTFDRSIGEYMVTFAEYVEGVTQTKRGFQHWKPRKEMSGLL